MKILNKIMIKFKEYQYKKYIEEHRNNVKDAFTEIIMNNEIYTFIQEHNLYEDLLIRIENHDLSKYEKEEFNAYRQYYYPTKTEKKNISNIERAFNEAWEHHYLNNDHHWENRQNNTDVNILAILENLCDWLAMGYKFNDRPYLYYNKVKNKIKLNNDDRLLLEKFINIIDKDYINGKNKNYKKPCMI